MENRAQTTIIWVGIWTVDKVMELFLRIHFGGWIQIWAYLESYPNDNYFTKSFCILILNKNSGHNDLWKKIWLGYAPYRVEDFVWQLMWERIAIKVELVKRKLIGENQSYYVLCKKNIELVRHLFFTCEETWKIWHMWCLD